MLGLGYLSSACILSYPRGLMKMHIRSRNIHPKLRIQHIIFQPLHFSIKKNSFHLRAIQIASILRSLSPSSELESSPPISMLMADGVEGLTACLTEGRRIGA